MAEKSLGTRGVFGLTRLPANSHTVEAQVDRTVPQVVVKCTSGVDPEVLDAQRSLHRLFSPRLFVNNPAVGLIFILPSDRPATVLIFTPVRSSS
jgi:hypothetical protein